MTAHPHLSDEQFAALLAGAPGPAESRHWESCDDCRSQLSGFAVDVGNWAVAARAQADRPPAFWTRQSAAVLSRTRARHARRLWTPLAAAASLLLAAAIVLTGLAPRQPVSSKLAEPTDDALLQQIQQTLSSDVPEALAPATVLSDELSARAFPSDLRGEAQ